MKIISVDFQREFSAEGGLCYRPRPCVPFIKEVLFPFVRARGLGVAEIISDYRLPRQGGGFEACVPGTRGYESEVPADIKDARVRVKAFSSPVWVREHGGDPDREPGLPYPDHRGFGEWLTATVGAPGDGPEPILIGLTVDGCVLSALQELRYIGYRARVLAEAVDTYSGDAAEKRFLLEKVIPYWGQPVTWGELNT